MAGLLAALMIPSAAARFGARTPITELATLVMAGVVSYGVASKSLRVEALRKLFDRQSERQNGLS